MYAIVKTGGKQYRVEPGRWLLIERLPVEEGAEITLEPLLFVDGDQFVDGAALSEVTVNAKVLAHERGPKLRIVKFKPKRGYKRRTGHRQELTRIEVTGIERGGETASADEPQTKSAAAPAPVALTGETATTTAPEATDGA
jgi:large subunit ribosomal protein L21